MYYTFSRKVLTSVSKFITTKTDKMTFFQFHEMESQNFLEYLHSDYSFQNVCYTYDDGETFSVSNKRFQKQTLQNIFLYGIGSRVGVPFLGRTCAKH